MGGFSGGGVGVRTGDCVGDLKVGGRVGESV